ncbi:hypothetical protein LTR08_007367 [Meristemomyces frigidus]|nr:hypothetical protein LTR08_007367 [Meristemomyces frigidus]
MYSQGIDPLDPMSSTPYLIAASFNLADLNWPVPVSAYENQPRFALGRDVFSVVFDDYNPVLAVPPEIRSLDPAWKSCALDWQGLYDPPKALHPASVMAGPTTAAGGPVTTVAVPSSTPELPANQTPTPSAVTLVSSIAFAPLVISQSGEQSNTGPTSAEPSSGPPSVLETNAPGQGRSSSQPAAAASSDITETGQDGTGLTRTPSPASGDATQTHASVESDPSEQGAPTPSSSLPTVATSIEGSLDLTTVLAQSFTGLSTTTVVASSDSAHVGLDGSDTPSVSETTTVDVSAAEDPTAMASPVDTSSPQTAGGFGYASATLSDTTYSTSGLHSPIVALSNEDTTGSAVHTMYDPTMSSGTYEVITGTSTLDAMTLVDTTSHSMPSDTTAFADGTDSTRSEDRRESTASSTKRLQSIDPPDAVATFTFGSQVYTASRNGASVAVIAGHTVSAGGPGFAVPAGTLGLGTEDNILMMWTDRTSATSLNPTSPHATTVVGEGAIVTLSSSTLTAIKPQSALDGVILVDGTTLSAGGPPLSVTGEAVSAVFGGIVVAAGGSRTTITLQDTTMTSAASKHILTQLPSYVSSTPNDRQATAATSTQTTTGSGERLLPIERAMYWLLLLIFAHLAFGAVQHG